MRIAVDSNRYSDFCAGDERAVEVIQSASVIFMPLIVVAELRAGFAHGTRREKNERVLSTFLSQDGVEVLLPNEQTTHFYANIYASLRKKGKPIPTNDIWIAALVIQHSLVLFHRDSDFNNIAGLASL